MQNTASRILEEILSYRCPRYEELPTIPLYSEQVIDLIHHYAAPFLIFDGDARLTSTMINNYVKQRLIPPPEKKRYGQEHIARLYVIFLLKYAFSVAEIKNLLEIQVSTYPLPVAYDYFCLELEKALQSTFSTRDFSAPSSATQITVESELVRSTALALANKLFAAKSLYLYTLIKEEQNSSTQPT